MEKGSHTVFMNRAIELAIANVNNGTGGPFGAVVVKDSTIISEGVNLVTATNDPTAHAEINAIRAACTALKSFKLTGCLLYTSAEPCPMCLGAIYWARIECVYFANTKQEAADIGFDDSFIYAELSKPLPERSIPMHHLADPHALKAFLLWKQKPSKILY